MYLFSIKRMRIQALKALATGMLFASALLTTGISAAATNEAGKFLFVLGNVTVTGDVARTASKGMPVHTGDTVKTGDTGRAQMLMIDQAKIALRPGSIFQVEEYSLPATPEDASLAVETEGGSSVLRLLEGGLRTISGSIGEEEGDEYAIKTPVATIGIRGTDYTIVLTGSNPPVLYIGVTEGEVYVTNNAGELTVYANEFAVVEGIDIVPALLDEPPQIITEEQGDTGDEEDAGSGSGDSGDDSGSAGGGSTGDGDDGGGEESGGGVDSGDGSDSGGEGAGGGVAGGEDDSGDSGDSGNFRASNDRRAPPPAEQGVPVINPAIPSTGIEAPVIPIDTSGGDLSDGAPDTTQTPVSFALPNGPFPNQNGSSRNPVTEDASGNLEAFTAPIFTGNGTQVMDVDIGDASNLNTGEAVDQGLQWGRWSGGLINVTDAAGNSQSQDLTQSSLHWVTGALEGSTPATPTTGIANYSLLGNTDPTDQQGNVGVLGSAILEADFGQSTVNSTVNLSIGGNVWNATTTSSSIVDANFNGQYSTTVSGQTGNGVGAFSGFFTAPGAGGNPDGAGLTYSLTDPNGTQTVNGAAAFGDPQ